MDIVAFLALPSNHKVKYRQFNLVFFKFFLTKEKKNYIINVYWQNFTNIRKVVG